MPQFVGGASFVNLVQWAYPLQPSSLGMEPSKGILLTRIRRLRGLSVQSVPIGLGRDWPSGCHRGLGMSRLHRVYPSAELSATGFVSEASLHAVTAVIACGILNLKVRVHRDRIQRPQFPNVYPTKSVFCARLGDLWDKNRSINALSRRLGTGPDPGVPSNHM